MHTLYLPCTPCNLSTAHAPSRCGTWDPGSGTSWPSALLCSSKQWALYAGKEGACGAPPAADELDVAGLEESILGLDSTAAGASLSSAPEQPQGGSSPSGSEGWRSTPSWVNRAEEGKRPSKSEKKMLSKMYRKAKKAEHKQR